VLLLKVCSTPEILLSIVEKTPLSVDIQSVNSQHICPLEDALKEVDFRGMIIINKQEVCE
jgi:hypothetical protein